MTSVRTSWAGMRNDSTGWTERYSCLTGFELPTLHLGQALRDLLLRDAVDPHLALALLIADYSTLTPASLTSLR